MDEQQYTIISIRKSPEYAERAIDWFSSKWDIDRKEYEKSFSDCLNKKELLPQWYLAIDSDDEIAGGCGLVRNDFVDRTDLYPYLCALFVEEKARGNALGARLLENARTDAGKIGFDVLYLCTDHTGYYEKYGWKYITTGKQLHGGTSRIYAAPTIKKRPLEKIDDFFTARINSYEGHMLKGGNEIYLKFAELVPENTESIIDLGCGTGLELEEIYRRLPDVSVTGIDLTPVMLDRLKQKYPGKNIELICGDFFSIDFGENAFDTALSFQSMHHFPHVEKVGLYRKILKALKPGGVYIEGDYMVTEQAVEDLLFTESARLRREMNIPEGEYYHFDIPCTVDNQIAMLRQAGFTSTEQLFRLEGTTIIIAKK